MFSKIILFAVLAASDIQFNTEAAEPPAEQPDKLPLEQLPITHVEVNYGPRSTQVVALDAEDQVAAEIVVGVVDEGHIRFDATFPDDIHVMAVVNGKGEIIEIDNEAYELVAPRIAAVADFLAQTEQAGALPCAVHSTMAVIEFAHANPFAIVSTVLAACECLPMLVEEFEDIECPGF